MQFTFFFFNDTATTEIYTLSLHDALPISNAAWIGATGARRLRPVRLATERVCHWRRGPPRRGPDRKSTRLNSSHGYISYAVFCLKKKKPPPQRLIPVIAVKAPAVAVHRLL